MEIKFEPTSDTEFESLCNCRNENQQDDCTRTNGHILGNFPRYYEFNPPDHRLTAIGKGIWAELSSSKQHISFLDVGCNDGTLTNLIREEILSSGYESVSAYGVDIDSELVKRARKTYPECVFTCCDFLLDPSIEQYDIVCCFGTTMWVHLNHGDAGLSNLIIKLCKKARLSLLLEPQNWHSYRNAKRRLRKMNHTVPESFTSISVQGDDEIQTLTYEVANKYFGSNRTLGVTKNWNRSILQFYDKKICLNV